MHSLPQISSHQSFRHLGTSLEKTWNQQCDLCRSATCKVFLVNIKTLVSWMWPQNAQFVHINLLNPRFSPVPEPVSFFPYTAYNNHLRKINIYNRHNMTKQSHNKVLSTAFKMKPYWTEMLGWVSWGTVSCRRTWPVHPKLTVWFPVILNLNTLQFLL